MNDRFIPTYDNGKSYIVDKESKREDRKILNNVIKYAHILNELNEENKQMRKFIDELERLTGQSIEEIVEFHMIMG